MSVLFYDIPPVKCLNLNWKWKDLNVSYLLAAHIFPSVDYNHTTDALLPPVLQL